MNLKMQLQNDAKDYCARAQISLPRLATLVVNDGKFFDRLAKGGDCTISTLEKFQVWFAAPIPPKRRWDGR